MAALWKLVMPMIVLSHLSASLSPRESARPERHADGLFHSELSKMNGNAYVRQLVRNLVGLKERPQRHSDGLFTSEYSKMRGNAQVQRFIQSLMGRKRSSPGPVDADTRGTEEESSHEEFCFEWLYQSFLNHSRSDGVAREAAAAAGQLVCPISRLLFAGGRGGAGGLE